MFIKGLLFNVMLYGIKLQQQGLTSAQQEALGGKGTVMFSMGVSMFSGNAVAIEAF